MKQSNYSAGSPRAASGQRTELINRAILGIIAEATNRYPSEVPLPAICTDDRELLGQVLRFFAEEGLFRMTGKAVALTRSGYAAVEQVGPTDHRLSEILQGGSLPAEGSGSSSLMLAILRANFERRNKPNG